jgi:hypothetical protein
VARQRDYKAEYARRQQNARKAGFKSYYDRRTAGATTTEQRAAKAGHRGTKAFLRSLKEGDLILCEVRTVDRDPKTGLYRRIPKQVIPARVGAPDRFYVLRNLTRKRLLEVIDEEIRKGVTFSLYPSKDQRRLVTEDEHEGGY